MSGIYIHIPFCKQACHYCNFHFSTSLKYRDEMIESLLKEIKLRQNYLIDKNLQSIYFGGGTPSLLSATEISTILEEIAKYFHFDTSTEITLEANPDDMSIKYLHTIKEAGINRLSVGVQSFDQDDLAYMNRAHNSLEATAALDAAKESGFTDFSIDLIYGAHTTTNEVWLANIEKAISYNPTHISSYCMTIEDGTAFGSWSKSGKLTPIDEEKANMQYGILQSVLKDNRYIHYEISNFAKEDHFAKHNSNYWKGKHYLGIGPAAHSFNTVSRSWNIANNAKYIASINQAILPLETELLTKNEQFNEYVMTGIRTIWGVDLEEIQRYFGIAYLEHIKKSLESTWYKGKLNINDHKITLTTQGKNFADQIASNLFYE